MNTPATRALHVVMFSQKVDASDWLLGFTVDWINALADRVARLDVITLEQRAAVLRPNVQVHTLGKERGAGRIAQIRRFERLTLQLGRDADVFFGHLSARYTWLAEPAALRHRVRQSMWYTHRQDDIEVRLALACCKWVLTAADGTFPVRSPKVHVMGHGIDGERFSPGDALPDAPPLVLAVGRLAPIKRHHVLLEAAARLRDEGVNARYAVAGGTTGVEGERYRDMLLARRQALNMTECFELLGPLQGDALIAMLRRASVVTNLSPVGLFDKAALEGMCVARPVLVTNPAFDALLGEYQTELRAAAPDDIDSVVEKLRGLLALEPAERAQIGQALRRRTLQAHSLQTLIDRIVALWSGG